MTASYPDFEETLTALGVVGRVLDRDVAFLYGSTYYFPLGEDWSVRVTPEGARRFRVDLAHGQDARASIWSRVENRSRLEDTTRELAGYVRTAV